MKVKILCLLFSFLLFSKSGVVYAQETSGSRAYLFDAFKQATVKMKNGSRAEATFNYDGKKQEMVYYANNQLMILDGIQQIDTIFIEKRMFIPAGKGFREVVRLSKGVLQIDWKISRLYAGKKGAYGQVTHGGTVQNINPGYLSGYLSTQSTDNKSDQVFTTVLKNEYYLLTKGKPIKFNSLKTLLKLFPEDLHPAIISYVKDEKLSMDVPEDVHKLAEFCVNLNQ